ncbi:tRNA (adenosine(37)-N6)-threonylcarbamoyltransferase complex ATPase subunit type 1 TsaE [Nitrococcus mobilis]|uniref:tRNA threonylcarbamoyladenosine biosynthesis protein TsaE n=1 Tax=Nitrococcus mobilis Nb-231 TaxID=314278 RepID=A4BLP0_9GAMM|nr:tRNA (adenosine(37)-N6)-threonylcarbamoyltransferase complex ATPase subunit type 1 TsaE [Nitrococcus mobilis]EAR23228.1 predicted ATPase or kinase [Nitrococcus mobilis Nb-231]
MTRQRWLPRPQATEALGAQLAAALPMRCRIDLTGELGAGKTTLVRGLLRTLGHIGPVRSPTYTLIEPYQVAERRLYHLDLYRLSDPEELEYIGLRDLLGESAVLLVEWPERGGRVLPMADLVIALSVVESMRLAQLTAHTPVGMALLARLPSG